MPYCTAITAHSAHTVRTLCFWENVKMGAKSLIKLVGGDGLEPPTPSV